MQATKLCRQGDVLFLRTDVDLANLNQVSRDERGLVLAEGDSTQHYHVAVGTGCQLFRGDQLLLQVGDDGAVVLVFGCDPPRHAPVELSPGTWEVRVQHAWSVDDERANAVRD